MTKKKPSWWMWNVFKLILAICLIFLLVRKIDLNQLFILKEQLSWGWLLVSFGALILMSLLKTLQYKHLIGGESTFLGILKVVIWQNAISNFVATSAGIASYAVMLKAEQDTKLTRSGITFVITKFGDLLTICFYLSLSAGIVWAYIQPLHWLTILLIAGILFSIGIFLITVLWRERFVTLVRHLLAWLKLEHFSLITRGLEMLRSLAQEEQAPILGMLKTGALLSSAYMTATMIFAYANIRIFDVQVGLWPIIYVSSLIQLVSFVPIQVFGGLGVSEITSVYLYSFFGLAEDEMAAVMLGLRAIFYIMNVAILIYLPVITLLQRRKSSKDTLNES